MLRITLLLVSATYNRWPHGLTHNPPGSSKEFGPGLPSPYMEVQDLSVGFTFLICDTNTTYIHTSHDLAVPLLTYYYLLIK